MALVMMSALIVAVGALAVVALGLLAWALRLQRTLRQPPPVTPCPPFGERPPGELSAFRRSLETAQEQATESERELDALIYSISHDLRAPLRGIDGFSQAVVEDYGRSLDATAQNYLTRVRANAMQINSMIDDLLALSRVVRASFRLETVDVSALARAVAAELTASEPMRPVRWEIPANITATADRALLTEAVRQLMGNAWKFTSARDVAQISFRALPPDTDGSGGTVYQVGDNGAGFDLQYAGRLFGAFQRMHAPEEFPGGRGIGLALVQRIVRRHGGRVWVESAPAQGARFLFTLESATAASKPEKRPVAEPPAPLPAGHGAPGASKPKATIV